MSRAVRPQCEAPAAQIEFEPVGNQNRRQHDLGTGCVVAEGALQPAEVVIAALGEGARQLGMPDEIGVIFAKRGRPEDVVGMDVGQDHIADRPIGTRADRGAQRAALLEAAAGIDDRYRSGPDDEADIGDRVVVRRRSLLMHSVMHKDPGGNLRYRQRRGFGVGRRHREEAADGDREPEQPPDNTGEKQASIDLANRPDLALAWRFSLRERTGPNQHPVLNTTLLRLFFGTEEPRPITGSQSAGDGPLKLQVPPFVVVRQSAGFLRGKILRRDEAENWTLLSSWPGLAPPPRPSSPPNKDVDADQVRARLLGSFLL